MSNNSSKSHIYKIVIKIPCFFILLIFISFFGLTCSAQDTFEDYAPIFYFEAGESCYPVDEYYIQNSNLYCYMDSIAIEVSSGFEADFYYNNSDCFLDNIYGTIFDDGVINHYKSQQKIYSYQVYYREYTYAEY